MRCTNKPDYEAAIWNEATMGVERSEAVWRFLKSKPFQQEGVHRSSREYMRRLPNFAQYYKEYFLLQGTAFPRILCSILSLPQMFTITTPRTWRSIGMLLPHLKLVKFSGRFITLSSLHGSSASKPRAWSTGLIVQPQGMPWLVTATNQVFVIRSECSSTI